MNKAITTTRSSARRGFSLVELLVVLGIIAVLASIISVGIARGVSGARAASEKAFCASLKLACEQFKQQFGFLPPVMNDVQVIDGVENQPAMLNIVEESRKLNPNFEVFYSVNTLAYYLVGAADKDVDGVDGPGFTFPVDKTPAHSEEGHFSRKGQTLSALVDVSKNKQRLVSFGNTRMINDRWDRPLRYYRWMPGYYPNDNSVEASLRGTVRDPGNPKVPGAVWRSLANGDSRKTAVDFPELRDGGFAIVSAGPDGDFGEGDTQAAKDNIVEIGQ